MKTCKYEAAKMKRLAHVTYKTYHTKWTSLSWVKRMKWSINVAVKGLLVMFLALNNKYSSWVKKKNHLQCDYITNVLHAMSNLLYWTVYCYCLQNINSYTFANSYIPEKKTSRLALRRPLKAIYDEHLVRNEGLYTVLIKFPFCKMQMRECKKNCAKLPFTALQYVRYLLVQLVDLTMCWCLFLLTFRLEW